MPTQELVAAEKEYGWAADNFYHLSHFHQVLKQIQEF